MQFSYGDFFIYRTYKQYHGTYFDKNITQSKCFFFQITLHFTLPNHLVIYTVTKKHRLGVIYAVTIKHRLGLKLHKYITEQNLVDFCCIHFIRKWQIEKKRVIQDASYFHSSLKFYFHLLGFDSSCHKPLTEHSNAQHGCW